MVTWVDDIETLLSAGGRGARLLGMLQAPHKPDRRDSKAELPRRPQHRIVTEL
jgi:hypothetical protein